ncbi:energy transducer TonB [Shewanella sp. NKUCC01_JLK]|uniref:energy transducer TonB n=1 Tax=Shewanella sp. NKUCC01_JLK TaxID=2842123 RepID=UPI001C5ACC25|nr:energy transducer TonB [Shewanella sp. NKUCC01_JLK]MBW3517177.1 energy transducer TonB [Shewanella sp. NKUCC01_JLK]
MGLAKKCIYLSLGMHFIAIFASATWSVDAQTIPSSVSGISLRQVELVIAQHVVSPAQPMSINSAAEFAQSTPTLVETKALEPKLVTVTPKASKASTTKAQTKTQLKTPTEIVTENIMSTAEPISTASQPVVQAVSAQNSGVKSVLIPPQLLSDADSTPYPKMAKRLRQQGVTLLKVKVSEHGECQQVDLLTSSGFDLLDRAAIDSAKNWLFESAQSNGEKVSAWVEIPVHFSIRG